MIMKMEELVTRESKGAPLTAQEHDQNLTTIKAFCEGLSALVGMSLNADGTLRYPAVWYAAGSGTGSVYEASVVSPPASLANAAQVLVMVVAGATSFAGAKFNFCGLGERALKKYGGSTEIAVGDIQANRVAVLRYDPSGDYWELLNPCTQPWAVQADVDKAVSGAKAQKFVGDQVDFPGASAKVVVDHKLPGTPQMFRWVMVCQTAEHGYAEGDEISIGKFVCGFSGGSFLLSGAEQSANSSSMTISFYSYDSVYIVPKDGGNQVNILPTITNWRLKPYAIYFP